MKRSKRAGLTLIELITGIAVLSVLSTIGMSILTEAMDGWSVAKIHRRLDHQAEDVFAQMRQDFDRVTSSALTGVSLIGGERRDDDANRTGLVRMDSFFILPVALAQENGPDKTASVMYHLGRGKADALLRTLGSLGANPPNGAEQALLEDSAPLNMRAEYLDAQGQWRPEWKEPRLPEAVRVSLTLCDANRPNEQIVRKSVFALHVK